VTTTKSKKVRHSRAHSASKQKNWTGFGNKLEHNQTLCDDKVTQTDLFCLPRSENFGISEETDSNWLTKIENLFFSRAQNREVLHFVSTTGPIFLLVYAMRRECGVFFYFVVAAA
jgi:hypothetical protein